MIERVRANFVHQECISTAEHQAGRGGLDQRRGMGLNSPMLKPHIKAVLFDKDGTLIDFMYTWYPVFGQFVDALAQTGGLDEDKKTELGTLLGDTGEGISGDSVFAHGSFEDILGMVQSLLPQMDSRTLRGCFLKAVSGAPLQARPIGAARHTLEKLKQKGYVLGVATADHRESTLRTLETAGLLDCFHFIGADDMVPRGKPFPDLMEAFCADHNLDPAEVAMVGDTRRDVEFARNSGAGQVVFVTCTFPNSQVAALADTVVTDINQLL